MLDFLDHLVDKSMKIIFCGMLLEAPSEEVNSYEKEVSRFDENIFTCVVPPLLFSLLRGGPPANHHGPATYGEIKGLHSGAHSHRECDLDEASLGF